jgi:hypothetical protein
MSNPEVKYSKREAAVTGLILSSVPSMLTPDIPPCAPHIKIDKSDRKARRTSVAGEITVHRANEMCLVCLKCGCRRCWRRIAGLPWLWSTLCNFLRT